MEEERSFFVKVVIANKDELKRFFFDLAKGMLLAIFGVFALSKPVSAAVIESMVFLAVVCLCLGLGFGLIPDDKTGE